MNPIVAVVIFVASFVVAWIGVGLFRRWSLRREIFDVPNERSSHTEPTPRGGGVVIVAVTLALGGCMGWNPYGGYNDPAEGQLQEEETQKQDKRDDYGQ